MEERDHGFRGSPPPGVATHIKRVRLHGLSADIIGPAIMRRTASLMLSGFPDAPGSDPIDFTIHAHRIKGQPKTWDVRCDDRRHSAGPGVGMGSLWVEWVLTAEFIRRWESLIHVHAGVISNGELSILLIGRSGAGKSTTSVALSLQGLDLYSDDVALIEPGTRRPLCVPRPIKLDSIARRTLRKRGLRLEQGSWIGESIDRTRMPGFPVVDQPGPPVQFAVFFGDRRNAKPELRPISCAEAAMRLILQSSTERFDSHGPSAATVDLVNSVQSFELIAGDLDSTVQTLRTLMDTGCWFDSNGTYRDRYA